MCCCINPAWAFSVSITGPASGSTRQTTSSIPASGDITLNLGNYETIGAYAGTCEFGYYGMGGWIAEAGPIAVAVNGAGPTNYTWTKTLPAGPWSAGFGRKFNVEFKHLPTGYGAGGNTTMEHTVTQ